MQFCEREVLRQTFEGKRVAIVGSGPGVLDNAAGFIDSHDVVCRVNNYGLVGAVTGERTDVHYSFYGSSIKKTSSELRRDGVKLCIAKCPDAQFMESAWHRKQGKMHGVDFRYIYRDRAKWWFCPTYVPALEDFLEVFEMLERHIPSTGFSGILEILKHKPASLYLTGFDFFASRVHNVSEPWRPGNPDDPIGHAPELERKWLASHLDGITMDRRLTEIMA